MTVRRLIYALSVVLVLAAALVVPMPLGEHAPGDALSVAPLVEVEGADINGELSLLTVSVSQPSVLAVLRAAIDPQRDIVERAQVVPAGELRRTYFERQQQIFRDATRIAAAAGARAAGRTVDVTVEVVVEQVVVGGPADGELLPGDAILELDGEPVTTAAGLSDATRELGAGADLVLLVDRNDEPLEVPITTGQVRGMSRAGIGITVQDVVTGPVLPDGVTLDENTGIGGPSAGLAVALTVYDLLSDEDLAAGRTIAVTGTVDLDGTVGTIGGLAQKVVAARRAGVEILVVPAAQEAAARALVGTDGPVVIGVTDIDDAIAQLGAVAVGR